MLCRVYDYLFSCEVGGEIMYSPTQWKSSFFLGWHRRRENVEADVGRRLRWSELGRAWLVCCWCASMFSIFHIVKTAEWKKGAASNDGCVRAADGERKAKAKNFLLHFSNPNLDRTRGVGGKAHQHTQLWLVFLFRDDVGRSGAIWHFHFEGEGRSGALHKQQTSNQIKHFFFFRSRFGWIHNSPAHDRPQWASGCVYTPVLVFRRFHVFSFFLARSLARSLRKINIDWLAS